MKQWIEPKPVEVPPDLRENIGGHPLVAEILYRRGIQDAESAKRFLSPGEYAPADASEIPNLTRAAERVMKAIYDREVICVWGDFDADGQTSTTLLVSTLQDLGADVRFHIPVRDTESHGIKLPYIKQEIEDGAQFILTCDTGIAEVEPIAYAQEIGVDVVVTDHHSLPPVLPEAYALVNPQMLPIDHPLHTLPGVAVAYKLAEALYALAGEPHRVDKHLDLVALGIVADVAQQTDDARYLLQLGLEVLRNTTRAGLQALYEIAGIDPAFLTEEHIGFEIAPRMNALGRLSDANVIVEFLTTDSTSRARVIANQLEGLNIRRKLLTRQIFSAAQAQIDRDPTLLEYASIVLDHPTWPAGVIGIVASKLVEHYNKPTILLNSPEDQLARGSARSIEGINITAAIGANKDLLSGHGGHPMAAGLAIDPEKIPEFRKSLSNTVLEMTGGETLQATLQVDGHLPLSEVSMSLVSELERIAPFGAGNPPVTLVSQDMEIAAVQEIGKTREHLRLTVADISGKTESVLWWNGAGLQRPAGKFELAYKVRTSTFQGKRDVQIEWVDYRQLDEDLPEEILQPTEIEIIDYRGTSDLEKALDLVHGIEKDPVLWAEGVPSYRDVNRIAPEPRDALVILTTPPGPEVVWEVLQTVKPHRVYLICQDPEYDQVKLFLETLTGMLKFALREYGGKVETRKLAAATGHLESTIRVGISWLAARGHFSIVERLPEAYRIAPGDSKQSAALDAIRNQLENQLRETRAFRDYFRKASGETLIQSYS